MFSKTSSFHKLRVARSYIERLNIPHEAGSVSSSFWLILAAQRKIIRLGERLLARSLARTVLVHE
jgi:hypothetical protein